MPDETQASASFSARDRDLLSLCARALVGMSRFGLAVVLYALMIESDPQDAYAHRALGICYERLDEPEKAAEALDRAIELDPDDADARIVRAALRVAARDADGAREDLSAVMDRLDALPPRIARRARTLHEALLHDPA